MSNSAWMFFFKHSGSLLAAAAFAILSYGWSQRFLDWLRFQSIGTRDYVSEKLTRMFIDAPPDKVLYGLIAVSVVPSLFIFLFMMPNLIGGSIFAMLTTFAGWKLPRPVVDWIYRRRCQKFVLQMVDALGLMANGMKSGLSVVQSLGLVSEELPNPIRQEFGLVLSENRLGVSLEDSFNNLATRVPMDDVQMFVTSINILKETGGNLAETLDTIATTIRERVKMEQKISAMTAQGFTQGTIVLSIPAVMALIFQQTDPEFMAPMFNTLPGIGLMIGILILEVLGFIVMMKVTKVEV